MDVGKVASLFIAGAERHIAGNDMVYTLAFKERVDAARLFTSYEGVVRANPVLTVRWDAVGDAFAWRPREAAEVDVLLAAEAKDFFTPRPIADLYSAYSPTNERLPLRLALTDDGRVVFFVNHAATNGFGGLFWLDRILAAYAGSPVSAAVVPARRRSFGRFLQAFAAVLWAVVYAAAFLLRAGRDAAGSTVDLTHGKAPAPHRRGWAVKTYRFTRDETSLIVARSKEARLSVTGALCASLARALLAANPDKDRVCMSLPVDLGAMVPGFSRALPGNFTGSLVLQARRSRGSLEGQVRRAFRGFARGVPYGLERLVGAFARSERALSDTFAQKAERPIPARAPFENFTCAVSGAGVVRLPHLERVLDDISGHTKTQTVFMVASTFHGRLTVELSVARDLFEPREVFAVVDSAARGLLGAARDDAREVRSAPQAVPGASPSI